MAFRFKSLRAQQYIIASGLLLGLIILVVGFVIGVIATVLFIAWEALNNAFFHNGLITAVVLLGIPLAIYIIGAIDWYIEKRPKQGIPPGQEGGRNSF